ncbi:MAG: hypothetical protein HUU20_24215 [Pirellulales bacterium]|nr:hypothetical protein [Pirellulales bacterium]
MRRKNGHEWPYHAGVTLYKLWVIALLANRQNESRVLLIAGLSRDLTQKGLDAIQWVRAAAKLVEGGGGGRPDMAQADGKDAEKLPDAINAARSSIEQMLGA